MKVIICLILHKKQTCLTLKDNNISAAISPIKIFLHFIIGSKIFLRRYLL